MSVISTKMLQAAAGSAGGASLDIDDVFSTYLYTGNGSSQTITNGIDLDGEGGLVWVKSRGFTRNHVLVDTERGVRRNLQSNTTAAEGSASGDNVNAFYSSGFLAGPSGEVNAGSEDYASWTFRKAPKFFDVQTWSGNSSSSRNISHSLGSVPGVIMVKCTSHATDWIVYHRSTGNTKYASINDTAAFGVNQYIWNNTTPTDSVFTISDSNYLNATGRTYVAYLFAHNDGDGEFGPDGDQDVIKCGSYTGNGSSTGPEIDLGFEPQWVMVKGSTSTSGWTIVDSMRGMTVDGTLDPILYANFSNSEDTSGRFTPKPDGFQVRSPSSYVNTSGQTYIYMAIRRGPLAVPEDATDVFAPNFYGTNGYVGYLGAPADMHLLGYLSGNSQNAITSSRLIQGNKALVTSSNAAEITSNSSWDNVLGVTPVGTTLTTLISYTWKRAPNFFDAVAYTGESGAQTVNHNLGVVPEMIWIKKRSEVSYYGFVVYHGTTGNMYLANNFSSGYGGSNAVNHSTISDTTFQLANGNIDVNDVGETYIAYLFASAPGVSKFGSYTGNGSSQTINCGFTAGARFILIKRTDATGDWYIWDTTRGIVAGNDPHLSLNSTAAQVTTDDSIDPASSGFIVNQVSATNINVSSAEYIFYAIA